ncbi:glycoside hydrolase family 16 protein [Clostridium sp. D2Q-11]|uniref:licheninase n=1 Tax=Anaeromonas frigoriresistens TaxID=2683708 RepID=A0A942UUJ0_9FIRM|nr:glycoside hydrolase family 16 protein [Anaeromonas frigoriresistens]MBS4539373.1 glycoside hydrolase family 16 protein [Anaeromonas frigoriresistens]
MKKITLRKVFLLIFLISIVFVSCKELRINLKKIKSAYKSKENMGSIDIEYSNKKPDLKFKKSYDTSGFKKLIKEKYNNSDWIPVERKDSYNNELQLYSEDNVTLTDNIITITSKKEYKENKLYTSGLVESRNAYKYGYFEFNIKFSKGKGLFPAIWFLPISGEPLPEIDLFEMIGSEPYTFYGVIHFEKNNIQSSDYFKYKVSIKDQYSVALDWKPESITWYIDDKEIYTTTKSIPQEYMYIIINQAIGGNWPGNPTDDTVFPNTFEVIPTDISPTLKKGRD